jgi:LacI family transcriptional regulator
MKENLLTIFCKPSPQELPDVLEKLENSGILGIITDGYGKIPVRNVPVVYLDPPFDLGSFYYVTGENYQAGKDIVRAFLERGHRDIVALFTDALAHERKRGVLDGLREAGIKDAESRVYSALNQSMYETRLFLKKIQKKFPNYTAVIAGTDFLALNVYSLLPEISPGKAGKIGLSGFGNLRAINELIPMATVDQHPLQMGIEAVEMLLSLASGKETALSETVPMEVIRTGNIPIIG